jgi:hypothetical protein
MLAVDGGVPVASATMSIEDFIATFKKPLEPPVLLSPPRPRRTRAARARAGELDDSELVPKRSARLAAKSAHREPKPEAQTRKVMMKRLGLEVETELPMKLRLTNSRPPSPSPRRRRRGKPWRPSSWARSGRPRRSLWSCRFGHKTLLCNCF